MLKPSQSVAFYFGTQTPSTGAAVNADSTPTVVIYRNGTVDAGITPTVTNPATGSYKVAFTVGAYSAGDIVEALATATVGGVTSPPTSVFIDTVDSVRHSDFVDGNNRVDVGKFLGAAVNAAVNGKIDSLPITRSGTAQAGDATHLTLDAGASAVDNYYVGDGIVWTSGANVGVVRVITAYNGTTKQATFAVALPATADSTPTFIVTAIRHALPGTDGKALISTDAQDLSTTLKVWADLRAILGTALTETAGQIAAAFKKFFNVASPTAQADNLPLNTDYTSARAAKLDNLDATVSSRTKPADTQAAVTTVTNLTNAPTAGDFTATMKASLNAATPSVTVSDKTGFSLSAAGILAIWNQLTSDAGILATTFAKLLKDNLNAPVGSIPTTPVLTAHFDSVIGTPAVSVSADIAEIEAETDGIANLPTAAQIDTQLSGTHGAGLWGAGGNGGTLSLVYTLTSTADSSPIAGATVELYSDAGLTTLVDVQLTNVFGVATFNHLTAGTYYLVRYKAGWSFPDNPDSEVVS